MPSCLRRCMKRRFSREHLSGGPRSPFLSHSGLYPRAEIEMNVFRRGNSSKHQHGQVLVTFVVIFPVLLLFMGLALDLGFAYVTKTALSKAADSAALAAMRNINQGQSQATAIAISAFNVNYQSSLGTSGTQPVVNVSISNNSNNNPVVTVGATATISTFFLGIVPGFSTLNVSSSAQSTRPNLIMSLILD